MAEAAIRKHHEEIEPGRDILFKYKNSGYSKNPEENERLATEAMREWATIHPAIGVYLENGGLQAAENQLDREEAQWKNFQLGRASLRASDARRREASGSTKSPGYTGSDLFEGGEEGGGDRYAKDNKGMYKLPGAYPDQDKKAAEPEKAEEPLAATDTPDDVDEKIRHSIRDGQGRPLSMDAVRTAREWAETGKIGGLTPNQYRQEFGKSEQAKQNYRKMDLARQKYGRAMQDAVKPQGADDTAQRRLDRLAQVSPYTAGKVKEIGMYSADPYKSKEHMGLAGLTKAVYPDYDYNVKYNAAKAFADPKGARYQLMEKLGAIGAGDAELAGVMKDMNEDRMVPSYIIDKWLAGNWRGDPEWGQIGGILQEINIATISATTMTGARPAVTLVNTLNKKTEQGVSLRAIRAALQSEQGVVFTHFAGTQHAWEKFNRNTLAPGMDQTNFKLLSDWLRMDPMTQRMPDDASMTMARASKDPKLWYSKLTEAQKTRPVLTSQQVRNAQDLIRKYRNSADPAIQAEVKKYLDLIGPIAEGPWNWPEFDQETIPGARGQ